MGLGFGYAWGAIAPEMLADLGWSRAAFSSARAPQLWVIALASPLVGALVLRDNYQQTQSLSVRLAPGVLRRRVWTTGWSMISSERLAPG